MTTPVLQPPTVPKGDRDLELAMARAWQVPVTFDQVWDPATCPAALLPWLAWGLSIDIWQADWPDARKRQMIAEAIERQRRKGSVRAVREVLDAFEAGLTLHEWFDDDVQGEPFTFEVRLPVDGGETVLATFIERILDQVVRVKPARAHLSVAQTLEAEVDVGLVAAARGATAIRLSAVQAEDVDWTGTLLTGDGEPLFTEDDVRLEEEAL